MNSREEVLNKLKNGKFIVKGWSPNSKTKKEADMLNDFVQNKIIPELEKPTCVLCKDCKNYTATTFCNKLNIYIDFSITNKDESNDFGCIYGELKDTPKDKIYHILHVENNSKNIEKCSKDEYLTDGQSINDSLNEMINKVDELSESIKEEKEYNNKWSQSILDKFKIEDNNHVSGDVEFKSTNDVIE